MWVYPSDTFDCGERPFLHQVHLLSDTAVSSRGIFDCGGTAVSTRDTFDCGEYGRSPPKTLCYPVRPFPMTLNKR
jgi:hypothetical protein